MYRKATRPPLDLSPERCVRLELFSSANPDLLAVDHANCADGIRDLEVIAEFFSDVRKQKSPEEAGLYDMIRKPDGYLDNCYSYGVVFAFFEDEPDLVLPLFLTSFNDLAYSVSIEGKSYVLPEATSRPFRFFLFRVACRGVGDKQHLAWHNEYIYI